MPGSTSVADSFGNRPVGEVVASCPTQSKPKPMHWVEIQLVGEDGSPIPDEEYRVELPGGDIARGYLNQDGWARIDNIDSPGQCKITFPTLDNRACDDLSSSPAPRAQKQN